MLLGLPLATWALLALAVLGGPLVVALGRASGARGGGRRGVSGGSRAVRG